MSLNANCLRIGLLVLAVADTTTAQSTDSHVTVAEREYAAVFSHNEAPCAKQSTTATYE